MNRGRFFACFLATTLVLVLAPKWASAQGTTTAPAPAPATTTTTTTTPVNNTNNGGGTTTNNSSNQQINTVTTQPLFSMSSGTGSATGIPSNANPFASSYIDPMSVGQPSKFTSLGVAKPSGTFGKALYSSTTTTGGAGGAAATNNQKIGFTTYGTPRASVYSTVLSDDVPVVVHKTDELHAKVKAVIDRSSHLPSKGNIQVSMEGATVQLQGQVATEKERRTAEGMVRMTPGVRDVQNLLQVVESKK